MHKRILAWMSRSRGIGRFLPVTSSWKKIKSHPIPARETRMDEDGDVATASVPRKRPHSPSISGVDHLGGSASHLPKRQRRIRARDPALDEAVIKNRSSLNRRMLKREAKKARRAAGRAARALAGNSGMDVDADMLDGAGLEFTFMADVESA